MKKLTSIMLAVLFSASAFANENIEIIKMGLVPIAQNVNLDGLMKVPVFEKIHGDLTEDSYKKCEEAGMFFEISSDVSSIVEGDKNRLARIDINGACVSK